MDIELLWHKLGEIGGNNESKFDYNYINKFILENPTKLVSDLDGIFYSLTKQRMKQLAEVYRKEELSSTIMNATNLKNVWIQIKLQLNCSMMEYNAAMDFCKISDEKFQRELTMSDAQKAVKNLTFIAEIWLNQKMDLESAIKPDTWEKETAVTVIEAESPENIRTNEESKFLSMLSVLQSSSKESVVSADSFGSLRDYMHVERSIQLELVKVLTEIRDAGKPSLILLCGSVGDGKSHLLAFMKEKFGDLLDGVVVHNDSTESFDPDQNSLETLEQVLSPFENGNVAEKSTIIAINLGVLHNFYRRQREACKFTALCDFIESCGIFDKSQESVNKEGIFQLLNFAETQPYTLTKIGTKSPFFLNLINKITNQNNDNPFYKAWRHDKENGISSVAHENYYLLLQSDIKDSIIQSLIEAIIKQKVFISTRTFYNFLYEIIVPVHNQINLEVTTVNVEDMLPNLIYGHPDRSPLLAALNEVDPLRTRLEAADRLVTDFILSSDPALFVTENLGEDSQLGAWKEVNKSIERGQQIEYSRLLIRHHELINKKGYDETYMEFISYLYSFYKGDEEEIGKLFYLLEKVIYAWKGSPKDGFIFMDSPNKDFRMAIQIDIEPIVDEQTFGSAADKDEIDQFSSIIRIGFSQNGGEYLFELDYQLYLLLKKVGGGYRPNRQDIQNGLQFSEFHDKILKSADKTKHVLLVHKTDGAILEVKKPKFSKAKFEVEKVN
ncbi:DNA phosphorothioation-dependent restriction protein DptF [Psychrobacillus sp. OK032]|uniref:DNA phosphorothioation-dependent restriction protein DptF n=1 Tax=Psychrobacillus sp. OK032 TaxID=1884358 RepID=UPI0008C600DF|nr:DNA phosphorothioation-dependent restriction protein DptF [Psychrobacillus sp. OK032]SES25508.1 DNA phosphorothioation-dependent restriction protein DptF [Psychrobacillus sp. OK032]